MTRYILIVAVVWASQYAPGVMERVVAKRQASGQLPANAARFDGYAASRDCADLGQTVWLRPAGSARWERFLVADCASQTDRQSATDDRSGYQWMVGGGIWYEVDHRTAARWDTVGRGVRVEVGRMVVRAGGLKE